MSDERITKIERLLDTMKVHLDRAIKLSARFAEGELDESKDEYWALVKFIENVQECVIQLDGINVTIFSKLIEFPQDSEDPKKLTWKGLKGMRQKVAHGFYNIDKAIIWQTATDDFPKLKEFLDCLIVCKPNGKNIAFSIETKKLSSLPAVQKGDKLGDVKSIVVLFFDERGIAQCIRIGHVRDDQLVMSSSKEGLLLHSILGISPTDVRSNNIK